MVCNHVMTNVSMQIFFVFMYVRDQACLYDSICTIMTVDSCMQSTVLNLIEVNPHTLSF